MAFTVANVLELPCLQPARLLTDRSVGLERPVLWVSVIETPVEHYPHDRELVLSTGIGLGADPALLARFVAEIAGSGAAALAIATGKHVTGVPPEAVAAAERCGLPLIQLPWELQFSEITRTVLRRLIHDQHERLTQSFRVHQRLTGLILSGARLDTLAGGVSKDLQRPLVILDADGAVLARAGSSGTGLESRVKAALGPEMQEPPSARSPLIRTDPELDLAIIPVVTAHRVRGYLALGLNGRPMGEIDRITLEHAATAAAICFLQRQAAEAAEARLREDFVLSLAMGHEQPAEAALARGRQLGFDLTRLYIGICGQFGPRSHGELDPAPVARQILALAQQVAQAISRRLLASFTGSTVILFLEAEQPDAAVRRFVQRVDERVRQELSDVVLSWGVGEIQSGLDRFPQTYAGARQACQLGAGMKGPGQIVFLAQAGVYRSLLKLAGDPEAADGWQRLLGPVLEYDRVKGAAMLQTLHAFLENQGNVADTARRLHLHRGSLLYRLRRIEELTGCSLADPWDRFHLELALRLYQVGGRAT